MNVRSDVHPTTRSATRDAAWLPAVPDRSPDDVGRVTAVPGLLADAGRLRPAGR